MADGYPAFGKIPRLHKDVVITEKIDGTNGLISIEMHADGFVPVGIPGATRVYTVNSFGDTVVYTVRAGSRNRWLTVDSDNYGFAAFVREHATELVQLGVGNHYGEWFGKGINRRYGLDERRFALFNTARWYDPCRTAIPWSDKMVAAPGCVTVVPILEIVNAARLNSAVNEWVKDLSQLGSIMVPGFGEPEGLIVYHMAAGQLFKVLIENDDRPKGLVELKDQAR